MFTSKGFMNMRPPETVETQVIQEASLTAYSSNPADSSSHQVRHRGAMPSMFLIC